MSDGWNQNFDREIFLARHWQRKPLLIRSAVENFSPPLDRHELAGLALEEGVESRIVEHRDGLWQLHHGPFSEQDFQRDYPWTLLVQAVDHHIPEVAALRQLVEFLPLWRMDDVMASYAAPHGTVGPHTDQYDVFLIQGLGTRVWQINTQVHGEEKLIPELDLRILAEFEAEQEFVMQPGDMLYLPPGVQHHGVSDAPCMTYSVGFRAATQLELLGDYIDQRTLHSCDEVRFRDGEIEADTHNGEIKPAARQRIRDMIRQIPANDEEVDDWFGRFITYTGVRLENGIPLSSDTDPTSFIEQCSSYPKLFRDMQSRFAYIEAEHGLQLYIDGETVLIAAGQAELIRMLCDQRQYDCETLRPYLQQADNASLLCSWWESGLVYFDN